MRLKKIVKILCTINNQRAMLTTADIIKISNLKAGFKVERVFFNQGGTIP